MSNSSCLFRLPAKNGAIVRPSRKASASKTRQQQQHGCDSPRQQQQHNGHHNVGVGYPGANGDFTYPTPPGSQLAPPEVLAKYLVGDIIGDGNFAVVRTVVLSFSQNISVYLASVQ